MGPFGPFLFPQSTAQKKALHQAEASWCRAEGKE